MKTQTVTPNLIQLTKMGMMNAYLVREEDGFTLVDTAMGAADDLIAAAMAAGAPIVRIALTHGHGDHVGSVDGLREKLGPGVPVLITHTDAEILAGGAVTPPARRRGTWPKLRTTLDTFIAAGDRVGSLEVIPTPGHTPGHVAFRDERDGAVIAGDTFSAIGALAIPSSPYWRFPLPWIGTCDRARVVEAARTVRALEPSVLAPGHGRAVPAPAQAIDRAIGRAA